VSDAEGRPTRRKLHVRKVVSHQLGYSYRDADKGNAPRFKMLLGLGKHPTTEAALEAWPHEVEELRSKGRHARADALEAKMQRLKSLLDENEEAKT
jgi:hypothetical protein